MKKWKSLITTGLMLLLAACGPANVSSVSTISDAVAPTVTEQAPEESSFAQKADETSQSVPDQTKSSSQSEEMRQGEEEGQSEEQAEFDWSVIPAYSGNASVEINGNVPYFMDDELAQATESYEFYSPLDDYGRCGYAMASVGADLMPTEERGDISSVHPTGWYSMKESSIGPERCHLIAYMLTGENANPQNLITGTHQLNVGSNAGDGMLKYEKMVGDEIEQRGGHVLYRVTPWFEGNNDLANGVLMEAKSVEDQGASLQFCVYVYNEEAGWTIDHQTGTAEYDGESTAVIDDTAYGDTDTQPNQTSATYIGNSNSMKFHNPDCSGVSRMSEHNKVYFATRDEAVDAGYEPCGLCNP